MKTFALFAALALVATTTVADAATRCRTSTSGSTTYTECLTGNTKTQCRTSRSGSTSYTSCR
jgi:hypothetical protein